MGNASAPSLEPAAECRWPPCSSLRWWLRWCSGIINPALGDRGWLVAVAAVLAWRALKEQKFTGCMPSLVMLALMLPYAGFADMAGRTPHHQTMVFGLALLSSLWLAVTAWFPKPLILRRALNRAVVLRQSCGGGHVLAARPGRCRA